MFSDFYLSFYSSGLTLLGRLRAFPGNFLTRGRNFVAGPSVDREQMRKKGKFSPSFPPFPFSLGRTAGFEGKREKPFPSCSSPLTGAVGSTDEDITGKTTTELLTINVFMGHFDPGVDLLVVWTCPSCSDTTSCS